MGLGVLHWEYWDGTGGVLGMLGWDWGCWDESGSAGVELYVLGWSWGCSTEGSGMGVGSRVQNLDVGGVLSWGPEADLGQECGRWRSRAGQC